MSVRAFVHLPVCPNLLMLMWLLGCILIWLTRCQWECHLCRVSVNTIYGMQVTVTVNTDANCKLLYSINYLLTAFSSWCCWLGGRKGVRACKKLSGGVLACLSVWSKVQTCIRPSWCSSKIQIGFTFLVPAYLGSPGQKAVKRMYVCISKRDQCIFGATVRLPLVVSLLLMLAGYEAASNQPAC